MQATCNRCGRSLKSTESIARGYGKHCAWLQWAEEKAEADRDRIIADTIGARKETVWNALELIDDGGVVLWNANRDVYRSVSSDGTSLYNTTESTCVCNAGVYGRTCYHQVAVRIVKMNGGFRANGTGYYVAS